MNYITKQWDKVIDLERGPQLSLGWKVLLKPGTLRAEGYKNGKDGCGRYSQNSR